MAELDQKGGDIPGMDNDVKEKMERDTRWVDEWSDNLAVAITISYILSFYICPFYSKKTIM